MMNTFISGERQYDFVSKFNYVREAGTSGEQRAAETILQELKKENSDAQIRTEEFSYEFHNLILFIFIVNAYIFITNAKVQYYFVLTKLFYANYTFRKRLFIIIHVNILR